MTETSLKNVFFDVAVDKRQTKKGMGSVVVPQIVRTAQKRLSLVENIKY